MADDDKAVVSLTFEASGATKGAAEAKAAADQVIAADAAIGQSADKTAETVTKAEGKKASARKAAAAAAAEASRAQATSEAAAGDAADKAAETVVKAEGKKTSARKASAQAAAEAARAQAAAEATAAGGAPATPTDRAATSFSRQTRFLDQLARSLNPLGAAADTAASKLQALLDITAKGGPNAQRAAAMVEQTAQRLVGAHEAMSGIGDRVAEVARLTNIFDPATASAQRMTAELRDLNKALKLGVVDAGQHANAWQDIVDKYDEGAMAAKRAAAEQRALIEQARAAQTATDAQAKFNKDYGVQDPSQRKSAAASGSVFEEHAALTEQFNPAAAAAGRMTEEITKLIRAEELGIEVTGGFDAALTAIIDKYDAVAIAAKKVGIENKALEAEFNPLKTASLAYAAALERVQRAVDRKVISPEQAELQKSRVTDEFAKANAPLGNTAAEVARLTKAFDPASVAAQKMAAEIADLDKALALGVSISGGYDVALQAIVEKYDQGAIAAKQAAAENKALEAEFNQLKTVSLAYAAALDRVQQAVSRKVITPEQGEIQKSLVTEEFAKANAPLSNLQAERDADAKLLAERKALEAELNPLKTATDAYAAALERVKRGVELHIIDHEQAVVQSQRAAKGFELTKKAIEDYGHAGGQAAFAQRQFNVQMVQLASSIQGGQPIMLALVQQLHQVFDVALATGTGFEVVGKAIKSAFGALANPTILAAAAVAGLGALGLAAETSARRMGTLRNQLGGVRDDAAGAAQMADDAARHLAATTSLGTNEARAAAGTILGAREFQGDQTQIEALIVAAQKLSIRLGEDLPASAERMKKGLMDPAAFAQEMADKQLKGLDQALVNEVKRLQEAGDKARAFDLVLHAVQGAVADAKENLTPLQEALQKLAQAFTSSWQGGRSFADVLGTSVTGVVTGAINKITELVETIKSAITWLDQNTPDWLKATGKWVATKGAGNPLGPLSMLLPSTQAPSGTDVGQIKDPAVADAVRASSAKAGLDPDFVARLQRSEGLQTPDGTWKTSSTGALGPMQVLPSTYRGMAGQPQTFPGIEGLDVNKAGDNVQIGTMLLKHLIQRYDGDLKTAVLAYHDGETVTNRVLNSQNDPRTGLPQEFSKDALDQARKVMRGYSGTGFATTTAPAAPSALTPGEGAQTGRGPSGAANTSLVEDASKKADAMGLTAPARTKAFADITNFQNALAKLREENKQDTPEFIKLQQALEASQLAFQEAVPPAEKLTEALDRQKAGQDRIAAAYSQGSAAVAQVTAEVRAEEEARTQAAVGTAKYTQLVGELTQKYLALGNAEQNTALGKQVQDMALAVQAQRELADAYGQGEAAVVRNIAASKAEVEARAMARAGLADYTTAKNVLTAGYVAEANAVSDVALKQKMLSNDNQMALVKGETSALLMNNDERTIYLAKLQAEIDLKSRGKPINDDFAKGYIANAVGIAKATADLANQKQALSDVAGMFSSAFDTIGNSITQALVGGQGAAVNWRNVMVSVAQQILQQFLKLSVLNPILNELFHQNLSTAGSIWSALNGTTPGSTTKSDDQSGGILGSLAGLAIKAVGAFGGGLDMSAGATGAAGLAESASAAAGMGSGASYAGNFSLNAMHTGGIVGMDGSPRQIDRAVFDNAPRFHGGLGANEFATILERGERVLTGRQQQQMTAAANSNTGPAVINFNFPATTEPDTFRRAASQVAGQVQGALARARMRNG